MKKCICRRNDYVNRLEVRPHIHYIEKLYETVSEDGDFGFDHLCLISTLSFSLAELSTEKQETRNLVKNILESRDVLASLLAQLVKSKENENQNELCGDYSKRILTKLLDISKSLGCWSLLTDDDFDDDEIQESEIKKAFQQGIAVFPFRNNHLFYKGPVEERQNV